MTIAVIDVETTGLDATSASIVELAIVTLEERTNDIYMGYGNVGEDNEWVIKNSFSSLIKPRHAIEFPAMAVHHITEDMVSDAPSLTEALLQASVVIGPINPICYVAHNAAFDSSFLPGLSPWICTWRLAQHLWPEAPGHSNGVLRYWLPGLNEQVRDDILRGKRQRVIKTGVYSDHAFHPMFQPPHRALPDAWVTAHILKRMLDLHLLAHLTELSAKPVLLRTCYLGEHHGKLWSEVPKPFLEWLMSKGPRRANPNGGRDIGFSDDVRHTAQHFLRSQRRMIALIRYWLKLKRSRPK